MPGESKSLYDLLDELILSQGKEAPGGGELLAMLSLLNLLGILDFMRLRVSAGEGLAMGSAGGSAETRAPAAAPGQGPTPDLTSLIANVASQMGFGNKISPAMIQTMANFVANQMGSAGQKKSDKPERPERPEKPVPVGRPPAEADQQKVEEKHEIGQDAKPGAAEDNSLDWRRQWKRA